MSDLFTNYTKYREDPWLFLTECVLFFSSSYFVVYFLAFSTAKEKSITISGLFIKLCAFFYVLASRALFMRLSVIRILKYSQFVQTYVISAIHHFQIFNSVIRLIFINVVDYLAWKKFFSQMLFHKPSVHGNRFTILLHLNVTLAVYRAFSVISFYFFKGISIAFKSLEMLDTKGLHIMFRRTIFYATNSHARGIPICL